MAGQSSWENAGSEKNAAVVKESIGRGIYYAAAMATLFGTLNGARTLKTQKIVHGGGEKIIDAGNDSPVFKKSNDENNTAIFTLREPNRGMTTYGDANVKTGEFARYKHMICNVRTVKTPAYPLVGFESADNFKRVVAANQLATVEKENISRYVSEEMDFDALRAIYMGASRGILTSEDGGMGVTLKGAAAGQVRAPLNTLVGGNPDLTPWAWNATQHNTNLATRLGSLNAGTAAHRFNYETHLLISYMADQLGLKPVKIKGSEYRAVAIIDEWNVYELRRDANLRNMLMNATPRSDTNKVIYSRDELALDGILYIPAQQLRYFRHAVAAGVINYGAGMNIDPRTFANPNTITTTIVIGAGALLRGTRSEGARYTDDVGPHEDGLEISYRYQDGWRRSDWYTEDGREELFNDSLLVVYNAGRSPVAA